MAELKPCSLTELEKQIVLGMANCDMNIAEVGRKIGYHRNTVLYHLKKIKEKTGRNPTSFYDLVLLLGRVGNV